jgi:hypothetical protein
MPIDPVYFIGAFVIGLVYMYLTRSTPRTIIKYPTPDNAGRVIYRDDADVCYKYKVTPIQCPSDTSLIKEIPIQTL